MTTWRVGAILRENLADTLKFASWYLEAGADGITLLFDDPEDPAIPIVSQHDRVTAIACTPEFWASIGSNQDRYFTKRQNAGLTWIYRNSDEDWLLNVDADEFIWTGDRSIEDVLSEVPDDIETVAIRTAEIVGPQAEGQSFAFRLPMDRETSRNVYREKTVFFGPRRRGLIGHANGKSFTRTGLADVSMRQHWPVRRRGADLNGSVFGAYTGCLTLHFIGLDYEPWRRKLDWRLRSRGFSAPLGKRIKEVLENDETEQQLRELHAALHEMTPDERTRAHKAGCFLTLDIEFPEAFER